MEARAQGIDGDAMAPGAYFEDLWVWTHAFWALIPD